MRCTRCLAVTALVLTPIAARAQHADGLRVGSAVTTRHASVVDTTGGALGAAIGAAAPELGSPCRVEKRVGAALVGSGVGTFLGLLGILAGGWPVLITVPVGAVAGAVTGAHGCR